MTNTFTLADLQAMSNDDLNALSAELRGLTIAGEPEYLQINFDGGLYGRAA